MEHLTSPEEAKSLRDRIPSIPWLKLPDIDNRRYRLVSFIEYPLVRGWSQNQVDEIKSGKAPDLDFQACLAMLQRWMVFGFLEAAYQRPFPISDYVFSSPRGEVVRTTKLREVLAQHYHACQKADFGSKAKDKIDAVASSVDQLHDLYNLLREHNRRGVLPCLFDSTDFHAVMRLVVLVADSVDKTNLNPAAQLKPPQFSMGKNWWHTNYNQRELERRLRSRGWCPQLKYTFEARGLAFTEYASVMEPTAGITDPTDTELTIHEIHQKCAAGRCLWWSVNISTARAKHTTPDCNCPLISPPLGPVLDMLEMGYVPLIDLTKLLGSEDDRSSCVVKWEESYTYFTISHVWADGLIGDTERGLPTCQLQKLARHRSQLTIGSPLIWIDGLCIPGEPTAKRKGINKMADIYRNSTATLVYDAGLQSMFYNLRSSSSVLALRFFTSAWVHRLWTLQECVLAKNVFVAFKEYIGSLHDAARILQLNSIYPVEYSCWSDLVKYRIHAMSEPPTIGAVQRFVARRHSTDPNDEPFAIAPLLRIQASDLHQDSHEKRMVKFWQLIGKVPFNTIFLSCPRLETDGFTWAPRSLMAVRPGSQMDSGPPSAQVTEHGLRDTWLVYTFKSTVAVGGMTTHICVTSDVSDTATDQVLGFTTIRDEDGETGLPYLCDAIVTLSEPQRQSDRIHAVALSRIVSDPPILRQGRELFLYKYGKQLFLEIAPPSEDVDLLRQEAIPCTQAQREIVIA
ncbi:hypothetical protein MMC30_000203 [Trapelia coarctata]|nr:hypothetical protein [Trapelia coarctata]